MTSKVLLGGLVDTVEEMAAEHSERIQQIEHEREVMVQRREELRVMFESLHHEIMRFHESVQTFMIERIEGHDAELERLRGDKDEEPAEEKGAIHFLPPPRTNGNGR